MAEVSSVVVRKALLDASDSMEVIGKVIPSNDQNIKNSYISEKEQLFMFCS